MFYGPGLVRSFRLATTQSHPAKRQTRSPSEAKADRNASTAQTLASNESYTRPSTQQRTSSKTRSAGFNSGQKGGKNDKATPTDCTRLAV